MDGWMDGWMDGYQLIDSLMLKFGNLHVSKKKVCTLTSKTSVFEIQYNQ